MRDLLGRRVGKRVGTTDHEGFESQAGIERRAAEAVVRGGDRRDGVAQIGAIDFDFPRLTLRREFRSLALGHQGAEHRRANRQLDARKPRLLCLPAGKHPFGVMGLDPTFEKAGRHRQFDGFAVASVELHAGEPTRVDVVADFGAKAVLHARPMLLIRACHRMSRCFD